MDKLSVQIREEFLKFFGDKECDIVPSDSLIPSGDKTLLFTSAGMVQFKKHFLDQNKGSFIRATSCQKCFRTSDIDQVGATIRHLTFFEMLGNFSFGDYFKEEAIVWAWEFLTKSMSLQKDRLYITVYKNDDESARIWSKIVSADRIIRMGEETNFWNMGNTGPCGPCSEILIDLGPGVGCGKSSCGPSCNCDRYLEIWNLVFTQFDRQTDNSLRNLPQKNIDTGMGLERLVAVVNGKKDIFETDLFIPIMENAAGILRIKNEGKNIPKLRIIADHSRAAIFLILDGILPANDGRGYVLRRVLRRALRQGRLYGYNEPFINKLVSTVVKIMKPIYPELLSKLSNIEFIVKVEEEKFLETLESGSKMLSNIISSCKSKKANIIDGKAIFRLHDTYGFPYDLTKEIASENELVIDEDVFKAEQNTAREKSRIAWRGSGEKDITFYSMLHEKVGDTIFVGYNSYISKGRVLAMTSSGKIVAELKTGDSGEIVLSSSSFYARSCGQVADKGSISNECFESIVEDVFKAVCNLFIHKVKVLKGRIKVDDLVSTVIDVEYRKQISRHHTATHLLHKVLRETLGAHVAQAGSLVASDYLRFDFTHFYEIKRDCLIKVEKKVNYVLRSNLDIHIEVMNVVKARDLGAIALFGEKYDDTVRTVSIKSEDKKCNYSMELCGGTHVKQTGEIGFFKIISEFSVAAGIRRIEAVVGTAAENYVLKKEETLIKTSKLLNVSNDDIVDKTLKRISDYKKLEGEVISLKNRLMSDKVDLYAKDVKKINGVNFLSVLVVNTDIELLRTLSDQLKEKLKSIVLLLVAKNVSKVFFIVSITADYVKKGVNAGEISKAFAADIRGSGGGNRYFAQGGSKNLLYLDDAMKSVCKYIKINDEK
ncbi:MAG: alanine--tRNA ligase [Endomicrobium sp.]|jgi:alanyl-tRNA synthetase|nr:alanine--tRNA ligase [Endomicrobium sp.]